MDERTLLSEENSDYVDEDNSQDLEGCNRFSCCNPRSTLHRFLALIFMCTLGFGSTFCYDNPGALQDNFKSDLNLTTTEFTLLYSIYSWPNVILCFIGGFLIDSVFGIRLGTNLYMFVVLIGQLIFASGGYYDSFWTMVAGRFIFGIGAESLAVAQNSYGVLWFKGKELNMVFGLQLSFARIGSTVNFLTMEPIYKYVNQFYQSYECTGIVLYIASLTCVFSLMSALILGCMDKRAERLLRRNENSTDEVVRLSDVTEFKGIFWMMTIVCVAYYVAIFPFIGLGKLFFITKFHFTPEAANSVNSVVYIISAVASPLLGLLIDKTGRNLVWLFFAIVGTITAHSILIFTMLNPYVGMAIMGVSYSLCASALWPLVSLVIPDHQLGTAYGICQAVQNLGLAIVSIVSGMIVDMYGYFWLEMLFISFLVITFLATIIIWFMDYRGSGILNMSPYEREIHECNRMAAAILEREKLLSSSRSQVGPNDLLQPVNADFHIRNRYLSRIGAPLPPNHTLHQRYLHRPLF